MKNFTLLLILSFLFISCTDSNKTNDDTIFCTEELRVSVIKVKHKDGSPYGLDSVKTFIETKDGLKDISMIKKYDDIVFQYYQEYGSYPVVGDGLTQHFPNFVKPTKYNDIKFIEEVLFVGYKDENEMFRRKVKAYTDACHVFCDERDLAVIDLE